MRLSIGNLLGLDGVKKRLRLDFARRRIALGLTSGDRGLIVFFDATFNGRDLVGLVGVVLVRAPEEIHGDRQNGDDCQADRSTIHLSVSACDEMTRRTALTTGKSTETAA